MIKITEGGRGGTKTRSTPSEQGDIKGPDLGYNLPKAPASEILREIYTPVYCLFKNKDYNTNTNISNQERHMLCRKIRTTSACLSARF